MADTKSKRCPRCGGEIDYFDTCRRCGRGWSEHLEDGEQAFGLPEGEQHPAEVKTATRKPRKNRFTKSGKRLQPEEKYSWVVGGEDSETEIIRKRSLMRLDSGRLYNALGLVSRAHEAQKGALMWLGHLAEFLGEEERGSLLSAVDLLKRGFSEIAKIRQSKISETAEMEIALEKSRKSARRARLRIVDEEKQKQATAKKILPQQDTEGLGVNPLEINPKLLATLTKEELLELAKERLANLDQEKSLRKKRDTQKDIFDE